MSMVRERIMSSAGDFTCEGLKFTVPFWVPFSFANVEERARKGIITWAVYHKFRCKGRYLGAQGNLLEFTLLITYNIFPL